MATADELGFFWYVRTLTGETMNSDNVSMTGATDHLLRKAPKVSSNGVTWNLADEIGIGNSNIGEPGETEFVPWWRVVRIKKLTADKLSLDEEM